LQRFKAAVKANIDHVPAFSDDGGVRESWPPKERTDVDKNFGMFKRHLFVFNRRLETGRKRESVLCIANRGVPLYLKYKNQSVPCEPKPPGYARMTPDEQKEWRQQAAEHQLIRRRGARVRGEGRGDEEFNHNYSPVVMLSRVEFEALMDKMKWIRAQLSEYQKRL